MSQTQLKCTIINEHGHMGFCKSTILWYKSYLRNRSFRVNIENDYSDIGNLNCGVPQGSILGPLIFLIYVNDMQQAVDCDLLLMRMIPV